MKLTFLAELLVCVLAPPVNRAEMLLIILSRNIINGKML